MWRKGGLCLAGFDEDPLHLLDRHDRVLVGIEVFVEGLVRVHGGPLDDLAVDRPADGRALKLRPIELAVPEGLLLVAALFEKRVPVDY